MRRLSAKAGQRNAWYQDQLTHGPSPLEFQYQQKLGYWPLVPCRIDPARSCFMVRRIGSRKRPYLFRVTLSLEASAVSIVLAVAGVMISSRPTKTRSIFPGAGSIPNGRT